MKVVSILGASLWAIHFIRFITGGYHPDRFMIGFSMILSALYFLEGFNRVNRKTIERE